MSRRARTLFSLLLLVAVTLLVYERVRGHGFVSFDDDRYITENPAVLDGLTAGGFRWAFREFHSGNWHPLTWLSHMLDVELFGLDAAGHHLSSVALHAANACLLFLVLCSATRAFWPALLTALLFALHPLRVESVAWASERKDVLAGLFWMLALWAYTGYARRPGVGRYALVSAAFVAGLLAKPMLVTLPFVLLLFDFWPLRRWRAAGASGELPFAPRAFGSLLLEKVPWLALSAASCVVTFFAQGRAVSDTRVLPLAERCIATPFAYLTYVAKSFWPRDLACLYPHPAIVEGPSGGSRIALSVVLALALLVLTGITLRWLRRRPYLASGWLWFLGTLVPVIGLVQVGSQAFADRYAYLPTIGLYVLVVWGVRDLLARAGKGTRGAVFAGSGLVLVALALSTRAQLAHWRDSEALWRRAVEVTRNNYVAHNALGLALQGSGQLDEAEQEFRAALGVKPNYLQAHVNLARLLARRGDVEGAISQYQRAIFIRPRYAPAHNNLGSLLHGLGRLSEARRHVEKALECNPRLAEAHANMAMIALAEGKEQEAARHFRTGFQLRPPPPRAARRFAWMLATSKDAALRNGAEAMHWARYSAEASDYEDPDSLATLAAACAEAGDFDAAVQWQRRAIDQAGAQEGEMREHLALYESRRPLRASAPR